MVNNLIDKKQFAEADALIDKYIAADPNNAQLYFVKVFFSTASRNLLNRSLHSRNPLPSMKTMPPHSSSSAISCIRRPATWTRTRLPE